MKYPYDFSKIGEMERYYNDFQKEDEKTKEEIIKYHREMAGFFREAASLMEVEICK